MADRKTDLWYYFRRPWRWGRRLPDRPWELLATMPIDAPPDGWPARVSPADPDTPPFPGRDAFSGLHRILYAARSAANTANSEVFVVDNRDGRFVPIGPENPIGRAIALIPDLVCLARYVADCGAMAEDTDAEVRMAARTLLATVDPDRFPLAGPPAPVVASDAAEGYDSTGCSAADDDAFYDPTLRWLLWAVADRMAPSHPDRRYWHPVYARAFDGLVAALTWVEGPGSAPELAAESIAAEIGADPAGAVTVPEDLPRD